MFSNVHEMFCSFCVVQSNRGPVISGIQVSILCFLVQVLLEHVLQAGLAWWFILHLILITGGLEFF